ncbi:hypothetical protein CWC46_03130 [Prodigiosinella confusarubida]|uniref:Uncharacterized protein n=1 Tax=Serratia sp. (strain ATCC 39006) TaxID=104623 RepID=A0A2I5T2V6_SERS3|nr:hypothetical protein CWC46_03130 [Serratia sp. ATCC 39006]AUH03213.1 hypothetical protein Ser39006_003130 [Serratia sp. ATCC 39006]
MPVTLASGSSLRLAPLGPLQATFKSAFGRFVTPILDLYKRLEIHSPTAFLYHEPYRAYAQRILFILIIKV